jgi:hypothetical protein
MVELRVTVNYIETLSVAKMLYGKFTFPATIEHA